MGDVDIGENDGNDCDDVSSSSNSESDEQEPFHIQDYMSAMKRNLFPCTKEKFVMESVLSKILDTVNLNSQEMEGCFFKGKDKFCSCSLCKKELVVVDDTASTQYLCEPRTLFCTHLIMDQ